MDMLLISGFCLAAVFAAGVLRGTSFEFRLLLITAAAALVLVRSVSSLSSVISNIRGLFTDSGIGAENVKILLKGLGICYLTSIVSGLCRDSGEYTLSEQVLLAGRIALLTVSLPLFSAVVEIIKILLNF